MAQVVRVLESADRSTVVTAVTVPVVTVEVEVVVVVAVRNSSKKQLSSRHKSLRRCIDWLRLNELDRLRIPDNHLNKAANPTPTWSRWCPHNELFRPLCSSDALRGSSLEWMALRNC
jgi:hypothetical protein